MHSHHLLSKNSTYAGFKCLNITYIKELQCHLREIVHEASGAKIMHIENDDTENLFCLSFQTLPYNSNGVAHILEHTVLCGSEKFPVKDPFFAMNRRSLNTFMNALTGTDFTCYPAATSVHKDFYNLLEVYLDAVFHPILSKFSFMQEGSRLEFLDPSDPKSPLQIKGIVYNEMKGALSSSTARLTEEINKSLFPNITYGYNSGGDPKEIPYLTYEELKKFHQVYYHPSRCLFFFYGNMPIETHLDFLATHTLNHTQKLPPIPPIPKQPRFKTPVRRESAYPISPDESPQDKTLIGFAWLTCHIQEQQDVLALCILEIILMDTDASLLKFPLLQSQLCKQAQSYIDIELSEIPCGIILKGCLVEQAGALENLIKETLLQIANEGIPLQLIENAIHQLEFYRSEITGDHAPFGLSLFMRSGLLKQHGIDPTEGLQIHSLFDHVRQTILVNPQYFSDLIRKYFIDNPHFVRIVMKGDPLLNQKEAEDEVALLKKMKEALSESDIKEILTQTEELFLFQKSQEDENSDILPKVTLKDIPLLSKDYPLTTEKSGKLIFSHHTTFTNNIIYADVAFPLPHLNEEDLVYLRLLTTLIGQIGCEKRSYQDNLNYIQGNTGGFGASINLNVQATNHHQFFPTFHIKGKALYHKTSQLFSLLFDTITATQMDDLKRLKEIIIKHTTALESRINQSALKYAINLSASGLSTASKMANDLYGLSYFWKLRDIALHFDTMGEEVLARLNDLLRKITTSAPAELIVSCSADEINKLKSHSFYDLETITTAKQPKWKGNFTLHPTINQGRVIASSVAFIGKVLPSVSYTDPRAPALSIASCLLDNLALHPLIREQGGAYGGGAVNNPLLGNFYFYSYRDPNIYSTLDAFEKSVQEVLLGDFDDKDMEEAKMEIIQELDSPVAPGSRAEVAYSWACEGRSLEMRQSYRNRMIHATKEQVIQAVEEVILPHMNLGATCVFAERQQIEKANATLSSLGKPLLAIEGV